MGWASRGIDRTIQLFRLLQGHRLSIPGILDLCGNLPWHLRSARSLFLGVFKYSEPFEAGVPNEIDQCLEFRIGLARKSNDERSPQRYSRNSNAEPSNQIFDVGA